MEALLAFAAALLSLRLTALLARADAIGATGARRLVGRALRLCGRLARRSPGARPRAGTRARSASTTSSAGCCTAPLLGLGSLLLYGLAASRRAGARLRRAGGRRRDLGAGARGLRRRHPRGAGPPRSLPRPVRRGRGKRHGDVGRCSCRNRHDQAPATRQCADPRRGRCCRPGHRSIRLGCCENGDFCGNCSTSSLRRFYSFSPQSGTNSR